MAHYVRFEVYIPVVYTNTEYDPETEQRHKKTHGLDEDPVADFIREICRKYHGVTQANPIAPAL